MPEEEEQKEEEEEERRLRVEEQTKGNNRRYKGQFISGVDKVHHFLESSQNSPGCSYDSGNT